jgi:hypothetical protein
MDINPCEEIDVTPYIDYGSTGRYQHQRELVTERNGVRVLTTFIEVGTAMQHARRQYAAMWQAKFGFPAPVELLDRWWPVPVGSAP